MNKSSFIFKERKPVGRVNEPSGPNYQDFQPYKVVEVLYILDKSIVDW